MIYFIEIYYFRFCPWTNFGKILFKIKSDTYVCICILFYSSISIVFWTPIRKKYLEYFKNTLCIIFILSQAKDNIININKNIFSKLEGFVFPVK